jgi:hypothetical protein
MVYNLELKIQLESFTIDPFDLEDSDPFFSVYFSDWEDDPTENFSASVRAIKNPYINDVYVLNMTFSVLTAGSLYNRPPVYIPAPSLLPKLEQK